MYKTPGTRQHWATLAQWWHITEFHFERMPDGSHRRQPDRTGATRHLSALLNTQLIEECYDIPLIEAIQQFFFEHIRHNNSSFNLPGRGLRANHPITELRQRLNNRADWLRRQKALFAFPAGYHPHPEQLLRKVCKALKRAIARRMPEDEQEALIEAAERFAARHGIAIESDEDGFWVFYPLWRGYLEIDPSLPVPNEVRPGHPYAEYHAAQLAAHSDCPQTQQRLSAFMKVQGLSRGRGRGPCFHRPDVDCCLLPWRSCLIPPQSANVKTKPKSRRAKTKRRAIA